MSAVAVARISACAAAAALALAALVVVARQQRRSAAARQFERRVRAAAGSSCFSCPLDCTPANALCFASGSFSLIEADLRAALPNERAEALIAALRADAGVSAAFELRREARCRAVV